LGLYKKIKTPLAKRGHGSGASRQREEKINQGIRKRSKCTNIAKEKKGICQVQGGFKG